MTEFMGFVRPNGAVGARNYVLILSGTVYANTPVSYTHLTLPTIYSV